MPFNNPKARAAFFEKLKAGGSKMSPKPKVGMPLMPPPGQPVNPAPMGAMPRPLAAPGIPPTAPMAPMPGAVPVNPMNFMRPPMANPAMKAPKAKFPKINKYL